MGVAAAGKTTGAGTAAVPGARPRLFTLACAALGLALVAFVLLPIVGMVAAAGVGVLSEALEQDDLRRSLVLTTAASLLATAIAALFGVPLAYLLARRRFRGKALVEGLVDAPLVFPHTAAGIALLTVYGREGVLGSLLAPLGISFTETVAGITVAMLFVSLPFLVDTSREAFALVDPRYEQVARTLGLSPGAAFFRVTLPQAWRGVLAGGLLMWARGISEFGAIVILAYNPKVIPVLVYERFEGFGLDAALPPAVVIVAVAFVAFVVLRALLLPRRGDRGIGE
jgi:molybdate/tungstate transport system permease protein